MPLQPNPYSLPLVVTAMVTGALGIYAFRRRGVRTGAAAFAGLLFAVTIWSLGDALQYLSAEFDTQYWLLRFRYIGILAVPVFWLIFAARFTDQARWISQPVRLAFIVIPAVLYVVVWTNDFHHLWWTSVSQSQIFGFAGLLTEWGIGIWTYTAFAYILILVGIALIIRALIRAPEDFRGQYAGIAIAVLVPLAGNVLFVTGVLSLDGLDITPFMFAISAIAFAWVMLPNRVFDVLPRAYGAVVQELTDGIIVTDASDRIVEINPAALELLGSDAPKVTLDETLADWPVLLQQIRSEPDGEQEIVIHVEGAPTPLGFTLSTLRNLQGDHTGALIHLRDISRRVRTEADLERTQRDFYSVIEDLEDPYFEADLEGRMLYVNPALATNSGYEKEELMGKSFRKIFARESIRPIVRVFSEVIQTGSPIERTDFEYVTRDGEARHAELSVSVIRSGDGEILGTRGIVHDTTELVQAQREIREERDIAERELEIGRQIQIGFFPTGLPSPPGWEIAARFQAAHQVAGDFYDSFEVGAGERTALVIADVCDKGVGAALFMALFRSLIRAFTDEVFAASANGQVGIEQGLRGIISRTNDYIANIHGRSNMFATLFLALLDPSTGVLHYVNAGHDAPIVLAREGVAARLVPTGPAVGMLPGLSFETGLTTLTPGDMLLAFTDGVIDARGPGGIPFGEPRLLALLDDPPPSASALTELISDVLSQYIQDENQFDDITLLSVRREILAGRQVFELTIDADLESLAAVRRFIEQAGDEMGLEEEVVFAFKLAADEACANVAQHAYGEAMDGQMRLEMERQQDKVRLTVTDWGRTFQLEEVEHPDLWSGWKDRPEGGLGLYLVREKMDELTYDADTQRGNRLTMGNFLTSD